MGDSSGMCARFVLHFVNGRTGALIAGAENLKEVLEVAQHHLLNLGRTEGMIEQHIKSHLSPSGLYDEEKDRDLFLNSIGLGDGNTTKVNNGGEKGNANGKKKGKRSSLVSITKTGRVKGLSGEAEAEVGEQANEEDLFGMGAALGVTSASSTKKKAGVKKTSSSSNYN